MNAGLPWRRRGLDACLLQRPRRLPTGGWRKATLLLAALAGAAACAAAAAWLLLRLLLAPMPGEWAVPVHLGRLQLQVGVPSVLRLATAPAFGPWLDGRRLATRWGPVHLGWQADTGALQLQCAPCTVPVPALGAEPLRVERVAISLRREFNMLEGAVTAGPATGGQITARFTGALTQQGLALRLTAADAPIARWFAVWAPQLPELRHAHIAGTLALQARLELPSGRFSVVPALQGFEVHGLGTEVFARAASACGKPGRLRSGDWLARAVVAAEDQRFFEHPGYDLQELAASLATNQDQGTATRGASTLTQQLAKRLVTGDARSAERKLRELLVAVEMERTLGKARILQLYLDNAPWGSQGLCGAEAAAQRYFQRSARTLTPAQAVWLAAMLHNPEQEARQWAQQGRINLVRAQWVGSGLRGAGTGPRERAMLMRGLEELAP